MPLRDDLLNPIPGDNPSGVSLRYERVYDQIKEARTEGEESILGTLSTPKKADHNLVIKLAGDALATKSKDLQLAAWLAEALVKKEGIGLAQPCLKFFLDLQTQFWDTLYPEIDEGDVGMRAAPVEWGANRLAALLREAAITRDGLNSYQYKESRAVGYEADAEASDAKAAQRREALADGKVTAEDFDKSFASTPKSWYVQMADSCRSSQETLGELQIFCEEKYRDDAPAFGKLRTAFEEVGQVVNSLLNEKRKLEPDPVAEDSAQEEPQEEAATEAVAEQGVPAAAAARPKAKATLAAEPADWDDAVRRVQAIAQFLVRDRPANPAAYLLQTSIRFGEMREQGSWASYDFLVSPPTETRQLLKRLSAESNWEELLRASISAVGEPCGRAWLDVHRYVWKAAYEGGQSAIAAAVIATLQALIKDIPEIVTWTLNDDTPAANAETQKWLEEYVIPKPPEPAVQQTPPEPEAAFAAPAASAQSAEAAPPDVLEIARDFIRRGQFPQAIQLLMRDAAQQPSGRARFQRRLQIAQLCVGSGQGKVAQPVLEELVKEIEERRLEEWEDNEMLAPPLSLLLKCLASAGDNTALREALFSRLCRIDPLAAMNVSH
ncbi:MAG TPA: type VI secretion system protein TssA [Acidobacteriaceae bacterium]